jgi:hypothetical protein
MRVDLFSGRDERVTFSQGPDGLIVAMTGKADVEVMARALESLHQEALARRHPGVVLDLSQLEPLEPAAVKALIKWAMRQAELDEADRYGIVLRYSESVSWQKMSLTAVAHLCPYVRLGPIA